MMGYVETAELRQLRDLVVEALNRGEDARELQTRYHILAEAEVDRIAGAARANAQIGLIVQMGIMRRDGGRLPEYREELESALLCATGIHLEVAKEVLREALMDDAIEGLLILGLDDEQFLMAVFAEAEEVGLEDPEAYLRAKGLLEG